MVTGVSLLVSLKYICCTSVHVFFAISLIHFVCDIVSCSDLSAHDQVRVQTDHSGSAR